MKCLKCGHNNKEDAKFCEKCGAKLKKVQKMVSKPKKVTKKCQNQDLRSVKVFSVLFISVIIVLIIGSVIYSSGSNNSQSSNGTTVMTENEYVAAVNNWTEILDEDGSVTEGDVVLTHKSNPMKEDSGDVAIAMQWITPPPKYANYNTIFEQAASDRFEGLYDMDQGKENGDHNLYSQGKSLVIQSASEFKSISNQTREITTWN